MNRIDRKQQAQETLRITQEGRYRCGGREIDISHQIQQSAQGSRLYTPADGEALLWQVRPPAQREAAGITVRRQPTLDAIRDLRGTQGVGVLNFASAKNPGGGFLGGALAQEESLAVAGNLYSTQLRHPAYYEANRACGTMMYTDHAIFSPGVVFFRDDSGALTPDYATASVLTLPAVNYGQVLLKREDADTAKAVMRRRMELSLVLLAHHGMEHLVLGAYGCGVFRNNPADVAAWWRELLEQGGWARAFASIVFAVLDKENGAAIRVFREAFPAEDRYEAK